MKEPLRWKDDPAAGASLKSILGDCPRPDAIPASALSNLLALVPPRSLATAPASA